jgi:hypothetical protein
MALTDYNVITVGGSIIGTAGCDVTTAGCPVTIPSELVRTKRLVTGNGSIERWLLC